MGVAEKAKMLAEVYAEIWKAIENNPTLGGLPANMRKDICTSLFIQMSRMSLDD